MKIKKRISMWRLKKKDIILGDVWDHIKMDDLLEDPIENHYDICWITISRVSTESQFTGILIGLRHNNGFKIITHDWTQHITLEGLLIRLNNFIIEFHKKYPHIKIIIIVGRENGGDDFIEMAHSRFYFLFQDKLIPNKLITHSELIRTKNEYNLKLRIYDRLFLPIKNERIGIVSCLKNSEIYVETIRFPYSNFLSGINALANMEYELNKIPSMKSKE